MEEMAIVDNFNSMCRLCLREDENLLSVFDEDYLFLPQRIAACVHVEIKNNDKMSTTICKNCLTIVDQWFEFKIICDDSQAKFRQWIHSDHVFDDKINHNLYSRMSRTPIDLENSIEINESEILLNPANLNSISNPFGVNAEMNDYINEQMEQNDLEESPEIVEVPKVQIKEEILQAYTVSDLAYELNHVSQQVQDNYEEESLLVPTRVLPSVDHGLNAPMFRKCKISSILSLTDKVNQCRVCDKYFSNQKNRNRHETNIHFINDSLVCSICDEYFDMESELIHHMRLHHTNETSDNDCIDSNSVDPLSEIVYDESVITLKYFARNLKQLREDPDKAKKITVKSFINFNKRIRKILETKFCECCNRKYQSKKAVTTHLYKQGILTRYCCLYCCVAVNDRSNFVKHTKRKMCIMRARQIQNGEVQANLHYFCNMCNAMITQTFLLLNHSKSHLENGKERCVVCSVRFQNDNEFKDHLQGPCYYKLYCSICNVSYETVGDFDAHSQVHVEDTAELSLPAAPLIKEVRESSLKSVKSKNSTKPNNKASLKKTKSYFAQSAKCRTCGRIYSNYFNLMRHISAVHKNYSYKICQICDKKCSDEKYLKYHIDYRHRNNEGNSSTTDEFFCAQCGITFATLNLWCEHQKTHSTVTFVCSECPRVFFSTNELDEHKATAHSNIKIKLYRCSNSNSYTISEFSDTSMFSCNNCDQYFKTKEELNNHNSEQHNSAVVKSKKKVDQYMMKRFRKCSACPKKFRSYKNLLDHKASVHDIVRARCQICNKLMNPENLEHHLLEKHKINDISKLPVLKIKQETISSTQVKTEKGVLTCNVCHKTLYTKKGLVLHLKIHESKANEIDDKQCHLCPKKFADVKQLLEHLKSHSPKKLNNLVIFNSPENQHSLKQNNNLINQNMQCNFCQIVFPNRHELNAHIRIHLKNKLPYHCVYCTKQCLTSHSLAMHVRFRHSNVQLKSKAPNNEFNINGVNKTRIKLKCSFCKRMFQGNSALANHMKIHQNENYCSICKRHFQNSAGYSAHKGWHVRQKNELQKKSPKKEFKCQHCAKIFLYQKSLSTHTELCQERKKSELKQAPIVPTQRVKLEIKQERVENDPKNKCSLCNVYFPNSQKLKHHVLTVHFDDSV